MLKGKKRIVYIHQIEESKTVTEEEARMAVIEWLGLEGPQGPAPAAAGPPTAGAQVRPCPGSF